MFFVHTRTPDNGCLGFLVWLLCRVGWVNTIQSGQEFQKSLLSDHQYWMRLKISNGMLPCKQNFLEIDNEDRNGRDERTTHYRRC